MDYPQSITFSEEDITPIEIPVVMGDKTYTLREASEDAACKYRNALFRSSNIDAASGKVTPSEGLADIEPLLVSLCMFDENGKPVSLQIVRSWKSRIVSNLYETIKQISELDKSEEEEKEASKNE